jgi:uracil-DNA glycosylase
VSVFLLCNEFLREEIEFIHPDNIVLLGDTARRGLGQLDGFEGLDRYRVKRDCGKIIQVGNYRVVLYVILMHGIVVLQENILC